MAFRWPSVAFHCLPLAFHWPSMTFHGDVPSPSTAFPGLPPRPSLAFCRRYADATFEADVVNGSSLAADGVDGVRAPELPPPSLFLGLSVDALRLAIDTHPADAAQQWGRLHTAPDFHATGGFGFGKPNARVLDGYVNM